MAVPQGADFGLSRPRHDTVRTAFQDPASLLLLIEGRAGLVPRPHHQKCEAEFIH
jgi:hypothetical protein